MERKEIDKLLGLSAALKKNIIIDIIIIAIAIATKIDRLGGAAVNVIAAERGGGRTGIDVNAVAIIDTRARAIKLNLGLLGCLKLLLLLSWKGSVSYSYFYLVIFFLFFFFVFLE